MNADELKGDPDKLLMYATLLEKQLKQAKAERDTLDYQYSETVNVAIPAWERQVADLERQVSDMKAAWDKWFKECHCDMGGIYGTSCEHVREARKVFDAIQGTANRGM